MTTVFWISALLLFHTYFGYALSAWLLSGFRKGRQTPLLNDHQLPRIALIIPACNEAFVIEEKCRNSLALDYPADLLQIIVVTDGSTDATPLLASTFEDIKVMHDPKRSGKAAALNRAVRQAGPCDVLIFSDANTLLSFDAIRRMMRHYSDPLTGGVSGEKRVASAAGHPVHGEGIYWQYESWMKRLDADFFSLIAAAGELFSIRRELWEPIPEDTILDDLHLTLSVCLQGFRFRYEPLAVATEPPSPSLKDEQERKIRIAAGAFQTFFRFRSLWSPVGHIRLWYTYVSRRIFRWMVAPLCLILLLASNLWIGCYFDAVHPIYVVLLCWQLSLYTLAMVGWSLLSSGRQIPWLFQIPFYFVFMHVAMVGGLFRYLSGTQSVNWTKSARH